MVIARANTPNSKNRNVADRIRYVGFSGVNPQEYFSYLGPVTYGHNSAEGAMGVAAYAFYAPFVPEAFTSPGPSTIYFDKKNKRYRTPQIRQKPDMAAMDGANTTFFSSDSIVDADTFPNFFGTSAAAPHAAAVAALVLDAAGGPGKLKPKKMRQVLQDSAFRHDLDPFFASGFALSAGNLLAINAQADLNPIAQFDPNVFTLTQVGFNRLKSISINGSGADPTQTPKGIVFDERPTAGQPFVVGRTHGLTPADVTASFSLPADPPGVAGQWKQLDLSFAAGSFGSGDLLSFGVDRDEADQAGPVAGAGNGNSADLLGGGEQTFDLKRSYGCGQLACSTNLVVYRSATLGYHDLLKPEQTVSYGGIRPGCWINALPAGGLVLVPDASAGCSCSYLNQAWIALQPPE